MTIISFKHRFIFIKTRKVGGTSVEAVLRGLTGPDDIVPALTPRDEYHCASRGLYAKNYAQRSTAETDYTELVLAQSFDAAMQYSEGMKKRFNTHMTAKEIRRKLGRRTFSSLYRFTIERDPFSWLVSIAGYDKRAYNSGELSALDVEQIRERIGERLARRNLLERANYGYYTIGKKPAVDRILRFENLAVELAQVMDFLGIHDLPAMPRLKENPQQNTTAQIFTPELEALVRERFRPVFELTGYASTLY